MAVATPWLWRWRCSLTRTSRPGHPSESPALAISHWHLQAEPGSLVAMATANALAPSQGANKAVRQGLATAPLHHHPEGAVLSRSTVRVLGGFLALARFKFGEASDEVHRGWQETGRR